MLLGQIDLTRENKQGDKLPNRSVRVLNALDDSPARLYLDSLGQQPSSSNVLTSDSKGRISAFARGRFKIVDSVVTTEVLRALVDVPGMTFSPMNFKGVGNGEADDLAALNAAITTARTFASFMGGKINRVRVSGEWRKYAVSDTVLVSGDAAQGNAGVSIEQLTLVPHATMPDHSTLLRTAGSRASVYEVTLDCQRRVNGLRAASYAGQVVDVTAYNFVTTGIEVAEVGDQVLRSCEVFQWLSSDAEFLDVTKWTGTCYRLDTNDLRLIDCIGHHGDNVLEITENGGTTTIVGCNFYNGNFVSRQPGNEEYLDDFTNPQTVIVRRGVMGIAFNGCYIGDGRIDLYSYGVSFSGCIPIGAPEEELEYFIGLHANGTAQPYNISMLGWTQVSATFGSANEPGKVPFIKFIDDDGTFTGPIEAFEDAPGATKTMSATRYHMRSSAGDELADVIFNGGIGLVSSKTPRSLWRNAPGLREDGGAFLFAPKRPIQRATGNTTPGLVNAGNVVVVNNPAAGSAYLPEDAYEGWHYWIYLGNTSAASYTVRSQAAYPLSKVFSGGVEGPVTFTGKGNWRYVLCTGNNAEGTAAQYEVSGGIAVAAGGGSFATLTGDPSDNALLAAEIADIWDNIEAATAASPHEVYASAHGVVTDKTDPAFGTDQQPAWAALEEDIWALCMLTGRRARIIVDGPIWVSSQCRLRELIHLRGMRDGTGFFKLPNFTGESALVFEAMFGTQLVGPVQTVEDIEINGERVGVGRGSAQITAGQSTITGVTTTGWVVNQGDMIANCGLKSPTFVTSVTGTPSHYTVGLSQPADYDNFNAGDPTRNQLGVRFFRGVPARNVTCDQTSFTVLCSNTVGLSVGKRIAGTRFAGNTRIRTIQSGVSFTTNKRPLSSGTTVMAAWEQSEGYTVQSAELTAIERNTGLPAYSDELKYCRVETNRVLTRDHAGNGMTVYGGRTGFHSLECRYVSNMGKGYDITSSDAYIFNNECGENFEENGEYIGATPRIEFGETYSQNDPRHDSLKVTADEISIICGEMTGTINLGGTDKIDAKLPSGMILGMNQKMSASQLHPDDDFNAAYMRVRGRQRAQVTRGCMKGETRTKYLVYFEDSTATAEISDIVLETRPGKALSLYTVDLSNRNESLQLDVTLPEEADKGRKTLGTKYSGYAARTDGLVLEEGLIGANHRDRKLKAAAVALVTNPVPTETVIAAKDLTTGTYDMSANVIFIAAAASTPGGFPGAEICLNNVATMVDDDASAYSFTTQSLTLASGKVIKLSISSYRLVVPADTTVNMKLLARMATSAGSVTAYGNIDAILVA